jgi:uncharacterized protein (TIGR00369 family)
MEAAALQAKLDEVAADYVKRLGLRVESVVSGQVTLSLPVSAEIVHAGGVVCGQAIMAAADTAMLVAMIAQLGEFRPMTTVQLQTSFVRPVPKKDGSRIAVVTRVLRHGKSLSYGDIEFRTEDGKLAAHATTTYALL